MTFKLPQLPYAKDALEPHISAQTLEFHHGKHHAAYVKKTNNFLEDKAELRNAPLAEVIKKARQNGDSKLFNNSAQIWNHSFFWQCLAPGGQKPEGRLKQMIEDGFGGVDKMLEKLEEEAIGHFSNGWAWLVLDRDQLKITSLHDADTPLVHEGMKPLFTLDVWEHAYYIDYRNERPKFVSSVLSNIVNWDFVGKNLDGSGEKRADQDWGEGADSAASGRVPEEAESR
ncbi:MAG TPA: superoxide dismutase [Sphingomicrobium sp.]|nr:superoxide dismutase [Sphingomicrobium sp.]